MSQYISVDLQLFQLLIDRTSLKKIADDTVEKLDTCEKD